MAPTDHPAFPTQPSRRSLPANRECKSQYLRHKETQITRNRNSLSYCHVGIRGAIGWQKAVLGGGTGRMQGCSLGDKIRVLNSGA